MYTPYHLYMIFYLQIFKIIKLIIKYLVEITKLNNIFKFSSMEILPETLRVRFCNFLNVFSPLF